MMSALLKLISLVFVAILRYAVGGSKLYPFGKDVGDSYLPVEDDKSSDTPISTPPFLFFGLNVNALYVSIRWENCLLMVNAFVFQLSVELKLIFINFILKTESAERILFLSCH